MSSNALLSPERAASPASREGELERALRSRSVIDISHELDASTYRMRSYEGFTKDMQFEIEVIKDYPGGLGQIVRGTHMRLHAGTHVDAPSHMVRGGNEIHDLPLDLFIGPAVVADVRHRVPAGGITADDLENSVGESIRDGDRVLLRTDINDARFDGSAEWMATAPYLSDGVIAWFHDKRVAIVGFDFYHGAKPPGEPPHGSTSRKLHEPRYPHHAGTEKPRRRQPPPGDTRRAAVENHRRRGLSGTRNHYRGLRGMFYEPERRNHGLKHDPFKALIVPRPIGWISSIDGEGRLNLAPYSMFNAVASDPPCVMFASSAREDGTPKDAAHGAEDGGGFVVNLATFALRAPMNKTAATLPRGDNEFEAAGLEWLPSRLVKAPRVKSSPVHLECVFLQRLELPRARSGQANHVTFGRVVGVHIADALIVDGMVDICRARPIARLGYMDYAVIDEVFQMIAPSRAGLAFTRARETSQA